uniref:Global nitrogen transcriptional regulator n=1 Tax=Hildenbrandia rivularis TaxID=135206 RepID=A0A1C9CFN2_9FLOR|nr:global nitrogen transcriptional regulator [Hildenbrandia rivularis]AOM67191.1 global nitrogen transcriptional regulator [Hildenbrandia rivularis]
MNSTLKKWGHILSIQKISFEVHEVNQGDCILINFRQRSQTHIITYGSIKLSKIFYNNETLTVAILTQNDFINIPNSENTIANYYYVAEALSFTSIISYNYTKILQKSNYCFLIYYELLSAHSRYVAKSSDMIQILSHRDKKRRLTNLLLILSREFGTITAFGIIINLRITHASLAEIIGSHRITVTKILNTLQGFRLISIYYNRILIHDPLSLSLHHRILHFFYRKIY